MANCTFLSPKPFSTSGDGVCTGRVGTNERTDMSQTHTGMGDALLEKKANISIPP